MGFGSHSLYRVIALGVIVTMAAPAWAAGQSPRHLPDLSLEELMGVSIERVFGASERVQPVTEAPASVTIITADDINRHGYRTLADILRGVRGFYVSDDRNYSYVGVRGFGLPGDYNSRVLLLVNGHKVNDNIYDQAYIGAELGMDVATFDRVEIIRGPASSLYGTSAFFAVVNIITRSGGSMEGISLQAEAGTLGTQLGRGLFGRTFANGLDVALSGTYERSGGVERLYFEELDTPATNSGIADGLDGEELRTAYGRFRLHDFTLTTTLGRRLKDIPTASYSTLFNSQSPRARTTDSRTMVHGQYERVAGRTRFAADVSFDRLRYEGVYPYAGAEPGSPPLVMDDMSVGARWGVAGRATRALPGGQTLTAGGEFMANVTQKQWLTYSDPMVPGRSIDKSSRQSGIYLQDEIRVRRWLLLNAGLRFDRYDRFARTTPRGAVIVVPSSNQSFKYLYGRAFRAPNAYELYYFGNAFTTLRPESIGTHELVWEQYVGEWLRTSVSGYRYAASRLIIADFSYGDDPIFFNSGELAQRGWRWRRRFAPGAAHRCSSALRPSVPRTRTTEPWSTPLGRWPSFDSALPDLSKDLSAGSKCSTWGHGTHLQEPASRPPPSPTRRSARGSRPQSSWSPPRAICSTRLTPIPHPANTPSTEFGRTAERYDSASAGPSGAPG